MGSETKTRIYALVAAIAVAVGLWWWLGGRSEPATDDDAAVASTSDRAHGSDAGATAVPRRRSDVDPWLAPRASVIGTVRDGSGKPIAGAQVCAKLEDSDIAQTDRHPPYCTTTAKDGTYRVEGMLGAEHHLYASARGYLPSRYESPSGIQRTMGPRVDLQAGQTREGVDFVLEAGGIEVRGVIKDISGGEIEGAYVSTGRGWWDRGGSIFTRSDEQGQFSLWVEAPSVTVKAFADGYAASSRSAAVPDTFVELFLTPESVVIGKAVWADSGKPVADAKVSAGNGWWSTGGSTRTDDAGEFRLEGLEPGDYKIAVSDEELTGISSEKVHVGLGQTSEPVIVPVHPAFSVRGVVLVDGETPCSYASVRLTDKARKTERGYGNRGQEDGTVLIKGLLPGTYEVTVTCKGYLAEDAYPDLVIAEASLGELEWSVHAGQALRGKVVDAKGEPVENASVSARMKAGKDPRARRSNTWGEQTEADGTFELAGLLPGEYELTPRHQDLPSPDEPVDVELPAGSDVSDLVLTLPAGGHVSGVVRDEKGEPVGGVSVQLRGPRWGGTALTNDLGRFLLEDVAVGEYRISARRGWSEQIRAPGATDDDAAGERIDITADETTEIDLIVESQGGRITGRVLGEGGEPIADAFVDAVRQSDSAAAAAGGSRRRARWGSWDDQPVLTDEDGRFVLESLAEQGTYAIHANRKGGGEAVAESVAVGSDVELTIEMPGSISGVVSIEGGGAPERFEISLSDREAGVWENDRFFRTNGEWTISNLPPGKYEVTVTAAEGNAKTEVELEQGAEATGVQLTLVPRITVRGRLVDSETGEPVAGLKVSINGSGGIVMFGGMGDQKADQKDISDAQGHFVVEDAPTGKVNVVVMSAGFTDNDYGWTWLARRLSPEPSEQDIGTIQLIKERTDNGQEAGDLGFKRKEDEPNTEPEDVKNIVAFVRPGGPAEQAGLKVGDEIVKVDGQAVVGVDEYRYDKLLRVRPGTKVELDLATGPSVTLIAGAPL